MAQIISATVSGTTLTIVYDEAMTFVSAGGVYTSSGSALNLTGFSGNNTATWTVTLNASIALTDYIVMLSDGTNARGTVSGTYQQNGTAFVGANGATTMNFTEGSNYQTPYAFFGNNGADTILVSSWNSNFISLHETAAASDTVGFGDQWTDNPMENATVISEFDVSGTSTNDKLSLVSRAIAANTAGTVNGTDVGVIASHSITGGIVTFKNAAGSVVVIDTEAELIAAYQYLEANIAAAGTAVAFQGGDGDISGLLVFQKGATGTHSFITALEGVSGVTLGSNVGGTNVVQIVDTTAPMAQGAAATANGLNVYFTETVSSINTTGIKLYKNGVTDMGSLTKTISGATVTLSSATALAATDFVVLDTTGTSLANAVYDSFGNDGAAVPPFRMAVGGSGNNTINLSTLTAVTQADGGAGADSITGTASADDIGGGDGNDTLLGGGGDDDLQGNAGNDILDGGAGNDSMRGGAGNDTFYLRDAGDEYDENDANLLTGGNDTVLTYLTSTQLNQNVENIRIMSAGAANASGNELNNTVYAGAGNNIMAGLGGTDTLSYASATAGVRVSLAVATGQTTVGSGSDTISGFENLTGSNYADTLTGSAAANVLNGGLGNDILNGGAGIDTMIGGTGNDTYYVDSISDVVTETSAVLTEIDTVVSTVTRTLGANFEKLTLSGSAAINGTGNTLANTLTGNGAANILNGLGGNDVLNGGVGNDTLIGGAGIDTMIGGTGNDTYYVDTLTDVTTETSAVLTEIDTVVSTVTRTLGANFERLTLSGSAAINGTGNTLANTLTGNGAANILSGLGGNDILNGGVGNDTLIGGAGNDTLTGGTGSDYFLFNMPLSATLNKDIITDFVAIYDTIKLENAIFTRLATVGTLAAANFRASAAGTAADSNDYILYNTTTGALYYDADGNGAGAAVQFAQLGTSSHPAITNADFVVY